MAKHAPPIQQAEEPHSLLRRWVDHYPRRLAVFAPCIAAVLILIIGGLISDSIFHSSVPKWFSHVLFATAVLVASLTSWIQVSLREAYGFGIPVQGKAAVI